ncbi:MAG: protein kinase, partial [Planctomycetaceae bacterium]
MTTVSPKSSHATAIPEIFGYQFVRRIGVGGMGDAVLARQLSLDRHVAIKILKTLPDVMEAEQTLRFEREALMMANLAHPNVVRVYDRGIVEGRPYLVMEYVEGGDLRQRMTSEQPMPLEETRRVLADVSTALQFLHSERILHRDLKPENILIDDQGVAKVTDFGIAVPLAETGQMTRTGQIMGTLDYIAPEQRYDHPIDERADQYSLGVLAYEMLTGHKPVGVFPVVSKRNPLAGVAVDRVLSRALQQDADERYATLAEFTGELKSALGSAAPRQRMVIPAVVTTVLLTLIIAGSMFLAGRGEAGRGGDRPVGAAEAEATATATGAEATAAAAEATGAGATAAGEAVESADFVAVVPFDTKRAQSVQFRWAKRLGREVSELNSLGMTLWLIPVGEFMMGSSRESIDSLSSDARKRQAANYVVARLESELPRHRVRLTGPFDMSSTEVT